MAKLTRKQLDEVVKKEAPGYRIAGSGNASDAAGDAAPSADDATPELDRMQEKYRHNPGTEAVADAGAKSSTKPLHDDDQIVALEPDNPADPWERGSRAKSIVVSGDGKVIGRQG
jgi:hypothetical protein